jgi:hypothetical protein
LVKKHKKQKPRLPTEEEILSYIPKKADLEYRTNPEGLIEIKVPKFKSNFGKSFLNLINKENTFYAKMDNIGSFVWKEIDGKKSVKKILENLKKEFPKQEKIDQRLYLFLQQMHNLHYIEL